MTIILEAKQCGCRLEPACHEVQIDLRTYRRWYQQGEVQDDKRPICLRPEPANKLSQEERDAIIEVCNRSEFASLPPTQIVPTLLDRGEYIASESSYYRVLRGNFTNEVVSGTDKSKRSQPVTLLRTRTKSTHGISLAYLQGFEANTITCMSSRTSTAEKLLVKHECGELASQLLQRTLMREQCFNQALVLHSDNGAPMKSLTFKAKMEELGITSSYSRPRVSDDNPYVESLFRTVKYMPSWPVKGFKPIDCSRSFRALVQHRAQAQ